MYNERFARQYHYRLPSEFPLGLPFTGIVHHLSGPNRHVRTRTPRNRGSVAGAKFPANIFTVQIGFATHELTHMLDSLVRVSRRGEQNHVVNEQSMRESSRSIRPPTGRLPCYCSCPRTAN